MQKKLLKDNGQQLSQPGRERPRAQRRGKHSRAPHSSLLFLSKHLLYPKWRKQRLSTFTGCQIRVLGSQGSSTGEAKNLEKWKPQGSEHSILQCTSPRGLCQFLACVQSESKEPTGECQLRGQKTEQSCHKTHGTREKRETPEGWDPKARGD